MSSDLNFFYKYVCKQILRWPVITYVTLTDAEVDDSRMVSKYKGTYTWNQTKPRFPGHYLAKHVDSCPCFYLCPMCKWLKASIYLCFLPIALWKGKIPMLSDSCKTPSVIKHHTANEKYPTLKCLSYDIQINFSKRVKAKTTNFQQIKEAEL